jgi:hypothetical protein
VLSELVDWRNEHPNSAFMKLCDWRPLDIRRLVERWEKSGQYEKPRIDVWAVITSAGNLTVCWEPSGINTSWPGMKFTRTYGDFLYFHDVGAPFERPPNELLFIKGVDWLMSPPSWKEQGGRADYAVSALVGALRYAYEKIIRDLDRIFEVTVRTAFDFTLDAEHQITEWRIAPVKELEVEYAKEELARVATKHGFTVKQLLETIEREKAKGNSDDTVNAKVAKELGGTAGGLTRSGIRHLRKLMDVAGEPASVPAPLPTEPTPQPSPSPVAQHPRWAEIQVIRKELLKEHRGNYVRVARTLWDRGFRNSIGGQFSSNDLISMGIRR